MIQHICLWFKENISGKDIAIAYAFEIVLSAQAFRCDSRVCFLTVVQGIDSEFFVPEWFQSVDRQIFIII